MATLKQIKGTTIQFRDADPVVYAGSWSSSGALNTARTGGGLTGSLTAGLYFGGNTPPSSQVTEEYNGTAWANGNNMTETARDQMYGWGTQTASISAAGVTGSDGNKSKLVELYNGTSWTAGTDNNTARQAGGSAGKSQTAGIMYGGADATGPGNTYNADTEYWNGSTWAQLADLNTAGAYVAGGGTYTSALCSVGGNRPAQNESWNGTSWSEISEQNTFRNQSGGSADSNTLGLIYGGEAPPVTAITESWDGTTWAEVADMATARSFGSGATGGQSGGSSSSLGVGGQIAPGARTGLTEEWTFPPATASALQVGDMWFNSSSSTLKGYGTAAGIPATTWATGGSLNTGHGYGTGFGLQTAALSAFGGYPTHIANTELYNGTAWTEVNNGNTARRNLGSFGVQGSGLAFSGGPPFGSTRLTESWNGTSWTEVSDLPAGVYDNRGIGTSSSSGLSIGGDPGQVSTVNEWNGSSWGSFTALNTGRSQLMTSNAGSVTAGLVWGGETPSLTANTELWNGSSWTEVNNLNTARGNAGFNGISTAALTFGGNPGSSPSQSAICEYWNGTSWTEVNDLGTGINGGIAPAGGATSGLSSGGTSAPNTQNTGTEEWTATAVVSTVTTS